MVVGDICCPTSALGLVLHGALVLITVQNMESNGKSMKCGNHHKMGIQRGFAGAQDFDDRILVFYKRLIQT